MPKQKTHKGTVKRIKQSKSGKLSHRRPFGNHFLAKKSSRRKREYGKDHSLSQSQEKTINKKLGKA